MAAEIEDLIFKGCSVCHTSYASSIETCPKDGSRLSERSLVSLSTLLSRQDPSATQPQLKNYCRVCNAERPFEIEVCEECGSPLDIPTLQADAGERPVAGRLGTVIDGKFRLEEELGFGAFGSVYLAKHQLLGKHYAIKLLHSKLTDIDSFRKRFHSEALKLSRLDDENIVKVIDFGEYEGSQYMVTEYVEGNELGSWIYKERVPPLLAAKIMRQVASALTEAGDKRIVHLDLKPANILVCRRRGRDLVKVIDFGIAEMYSEGDGRRQRDLVGTPTYMAPEQWGRKALDPRTDIYSFGVIFYELLAGRPPFRHQTLPELKTAHCSAAPPSLKNFRSDIPTKLERLVERCLEKDPKRRIQKPQELEDALSAYIWQHESKLVRWLVRGAIAAVVLIVLGVAGWGLHEIRKDKAPPTWKAWEARDAQGAKLVPVLTEANKKQYKTRDPKVEIFLHATDDREVERLKVLQDGQPVNLAGRGAKVTDGQVSFPLTLPSAAGRTTISATSWDRADNSSGAVSLVLEKLPQASIHVTLDELPQYTKETPIRLTVEELQQCTALITCTNGDKKLLEREVLEAPLSLEVPLEPGKNTVEVKRTDEFSGEEAVVATKVVDFLNTKLSVQASIASEPDKVWGDGANGWRTRTNQLEVVARVADAKERLEQGAQLRYRLDSGKAEKSVSWNAKDIENGVKKWDLTLPPVEGRFDLVIESVQDRYENASDPVTLPVDYDASRPQLELSRNQIEYSLNAIPNLRFSVKDAHPPGASELRLVQLDGNGQKPVAGHLFEFERTGEAGWVLELKEALFTQDGEYFFRIIAKDQFGNEADTRDGDFTVLADHSPPRIVVVAPKTDKQTAYRKEDTIRLEAEVTDFSGVKNVVAAVSIEGKEKEFPLESGSGNMWRATIQLGKDVHKPSVFDSPLPEFQVTFTAEDKLGYNSLSEVERLRFDWETGDALKWKDGSHLIYHEKCPACGVSLPFWIAKREVNNRQYEAFLKARRLPNDWAPDSKDWVNGKCLRSKLDLPVRGLTYKQVTAYLEWACLSLPSRKEWLLACHCEYEKGKRNYPWGDRWPDKGPPPVWAGEKNEPTSATAERDLLVGGRTPSGLEHMFGNVWELVEEGGEIFRVGGAYYMLLGAFRVEVAENSDVLHGKQALRSRRSSPYVGFRSVLRHSAAAGNGGGR